MSVNLDEMIKEWSNVRRLGTQLDALARSAKEAYVDRDGNAVAPPAGTISDIKDEAARIIPDYEVAVAAHKVAYMP